MGERLTKMSNPRFRKIAFETNTTQVLDILNNYLVNEGGFTPNYTKRSGKVDNNLLHRLRVMLSVVDTQEYTEDQSLNSERYKIYLCYALINYLGRNNDHAKQFFQEAFKCEYHREVYYYSKIVRSTGAKIPMNIKYNKTMQKKILIIGCIVVILSFVIYLFVMNYTNTIGTIPYTDAPNHNGESVKVRGRIVSTSYRSGTDFLDFCADYTTCPLSLVVLYRNTDKFGDVSKYSGQDVIVSGTISTYNNRTEIVLSDPSQIKLQ